MSIEEQAVKPKNIIFVTGTRADYGKVEPLATAATLIGHNVHLFVTGMHMMKKYGLTKLEIHRNKNFEVTEFINQRDGDSMDVIFAKTVLGFSDFIKEMEPDLVLVHGDRIEAFACATVCATNYIKCIHVEGGEVSGTIDEIFRHCITKLSWAHLVSSFSAKRRVQRLGESEDRIFLIGSPELDIHNQDSGVSIQEVRKYYEIKWEDYGICIFHPVTSERDTILAQASSLFDALKQTQKKFVVILPNNDPGSEDIFGVLRELCLQQFRVLPSMRFNYFSELLKNSKIIVGNSSMGVREAPFLGVPSLDVGTRQTDRTTAPSVKRMKAGDIDGIVRTINCEWGRRYEKNTEFGSGSARENFLSLLSNEKFWQIEMQKRFSEILNDE